MSSDLDGMGMPSFGGDPQQMPQGGQMDSGLDGNMGDGGQDELSLDNIQNQDVDNEDMENSFDGGENGNDGAEDESYENDFDAGVEADEDDDPEKYLQQLTGKLCAKLKKFNDDKPEPDAGMCKYIAGMVLAQCTKGLDEKDKDEILSKLTKGGDNHYEEQDEDDSFDDNYGEDDSMDYDANEGGDESENGGEMNESRMILERVIQNVKDDISNKKAKGKTNKRSSYKIKPYATPRFR